MRHGYLRKKNKWGKHQFWIPAVLLAVLFVSAGGVFAAYVSRSYVKGVATTPRQGFVLTSDYLSVVKQDPQKMYPDKKIVLAKKEEGDDADYSFSFYIANTADDSVSTKRISYVLYMSGLPEGATVLFHERDITSAVKGAGYEAPTMYAYTTAKHTYTVRIPQDSLASAADIVVEAIPDEDSDTSGFILAGKLQPSIIGTVAAFSYTGKFLDKGNVNDYAAFNYMISVSNAAEDQSMVLTWDAGKVEIDPLFLEKNSGIIISDHHTEGSLTLKMNDTNSSYLIQFYRLPGGNISAWGDLGLGFQPEGQNTQG